MATISDQKLDFWVQNNLNVLLIGKHGSGKTAMITDAFDRNNIKWKYFSAPTMDPWVDFIGAPREVVGDDGITYLDLVRPKEFARDEIQGLFFDELNRAKPKVLNAIMELIQFKSINGHKFNNLKFIWASINPEKDESDEDALSYMVEKLDPAQRDRFHVIVEAEYKPNKKYFTERFGEANAAAAIEWWNRLSNKDKDGVSPRRLQYALDMYTIGGDLTDVLPKGCNVSELVIQLKNGSFNSRLESLMQENDPVKTKEVLSAANFYNGAIKVILENEKFLNHFHQFLEPESFSKLIMTDTKFRETMLSDKSKMLTHIDTLTNIVDTGAGKRSIITEIKEILQANKLVNNTPISELLHKYHDEHTPTTFNDADTRQYVTALLKSAMNDLPDDLSILGKLFTINCVIGAKTLSNFWSETTNIFNVIRDKVSDIEDGVRTSNGTLPINGFYLKYVTNDKLFKHEITGSNIMRLEIRLKKIGIIT